MITDPKEQNDIYLKMKSLYDEVVVAISKSDDEVAHSREDEMMRFFVERSLDMDRFTMQECRYLIRLVSKMDFSRWCA